MQKVSSRLSLTELEEYFFIVNLQRKWKAVAIWIESLGRTQLDRQTDIESVNKIFPQNECFENPIEDAW